MPKVSGAQLALRALRQEGIHTIFTLVGDHILPLCDAAVDEGIRFVDTRHESAALHMADAFARVTRGPAVTMVTGGPGHANSIPGLAVTFAAESPVVSISGAPELSLKGMGAMQELDQVGMAAPVTKGAWLIPEARRVPEFIALAFRTALTGRPGPVHLTIPMDVQEQQVEEAEGRLSTPEEYRPRGRAPGDPQLIQEAVALLRGAQRPVVIAGAAAHFSLEGNVLQEFIETTHLPLFTVEHARGMVSDDHPLCFGYADQALNPVALLYRRADVVLLLGKKLDFRIGFGGPRTLHPRARIIQVDPSPAEIGRNRGVAVGIPGDVAAVVQQLHAEARQHTWKPLPWLRDLEGARHAHRERFEAFATEDLPMHPVRVFKEVERYIDADTCLILDGGDYVQWGRSFFRARKPGHWLRLGPLSHLGAGLPFALASKLALPGSRVFLFMGDGSIGFYFMEFDTALRHNLPIIALLGNDSAWGIDRGFQLAYYGRAVGTDLRTVRYDRAVEALGGFGAHVEQPGEIGPAVERALASGKPACIDIRIRSARSPLAEAMIIRRQGRAS